MEDGASRPEDRRTGGTRSVGDDGGEVTDLALDGPGVEPIGVVPWPLLIRDRLRGRVADSDRYPWIVLATALFGLFGVGFTITILAISVTSMAEEFNSSSATLAWVVTGPMLAFAIFGALAGPPARGRWLEAVLLHLIDERSSRNPEDARARTRSALSDKARASHVSQGTPRRDGDPGERYRLEMIRLCIVTSSKFIRERGPTLPS